MLVLPSIAVGVGLASCGGSTGPPTTSPSPSGLSSPPSIASGTSEGPGFDVSSAVTRYEAALDDLYLNPELSLDSFHAVAVTPDFLTETSAVARFRENNYRQQGRSSVLGANVVTTLPSAVEPSEAVQVRACIDVSQVRGVDSGGSSIVAPDRKPFLVAQLTFVRASGGEAGTWKVSQVSNVQAASCNGS